MNPQGAASVPPPLARRLLCLVYECVLLFGVVMLVGLAYAGITKQQHALQGQWGLRVVLFLALAVYFIGFWSFAGQTLAMKTWHLRLERTDGSPMRPLRSLFRFLLSWLWVLPGLAAAHFSALTSSASIAGCVAAGVLGYAAMSLLHPSGQFLHDLACGTRLVDTRPGRPRNARA
jgi:uncharacterized RDD family membrane protein YckC